LIPLLAGTFLCVSINS